MYFKKALLHYFILFFTLGEFALSTSPGTGEKILESTNCPDGIAVFSPESFRNIKIIPVEAGNLTTLFEPVQEEFADLPELEPNSRVLRKKWISLKTGNIFTIEKKDSSGKETVYFKDMIRLNLFEGLEREAYLWRIDQTESSFTWVGSIDGNRDKGTVNLTWANGVIVGRINIYGEGLFRISRNKSGIYAISEMDPSGVTFAPPIIPEEKLDTNDIPVPDLSLSSDGIIEIMIVWSRNAENSASSQGTTIQAEVAQGISLINTAYANSGISQRVTLAASSGTEYIDSGDSSVDLSRFLGSSDGYIDEIHDLREESRADCAILLTNGFYDKINGTSLGISGRAYALYYYNSSYFHKYAFGVVDWRYIYYQTLTHELGHLMGAGHERDNVSSPGPQYYTNSSGYHYASNWYTIMSYSHGGYQIDNFSNPYVEYEGVPTGVTGNYGCHNASTLNSTRSLVDSFGEIAFPPATPASIIYPQTNSNGTFLVQWTSSAGATSYELMRSKNSGFTWESIYTGTNTSYGQNLSNGLYRYKVRGINASGSSAWTTGAHDCLVKLITQKEVTASASAYNVEPGDQITLYGMMEGTTSGGIPAWYSGKTTNASALISNEWTVAVLAPDLPGIYTYTFEVTEAATGGSYGEDTVTISVTSPADIGDIYITYTVNGNTNTLTQSNTVDFEIMLSPSIQVELKGFAPDFIDPQFSWKAGSSASLSANTGKTTILNVSTISNEILVPVCLEVAEKSGGNSEALKAYIDFSVIAADPPTNVSIDVLPGLDVTPGTQTQLKATAVSATGKSADELTYIWDARVQGGEEIDLFLNGRESSFFVPVLEEGSTITVNVNVKEGSSDPVEGSVELTVSEPILTFSHFASGESGEENLVMELLLLNSTEDDCDGVRLDFFDSEGFPLKVNVDGYIDSHYELSIPSAGFRKLLIKNPDMENSVIVGWIQIRSPQTLAGMLQYRYEESPSGILVAAASLAPSAEGRNFAAALDQGDNANMGIALTNPNDSVINVEVMVNSRGEVSGTDSLSIFLTIPANGQIVGYLPEIIQSNGTPLLNQSFAGGTLFIQVPENSEGSITATVLRQSSGLLTTEPLAIYDSDSAIID